MSFWNKPDKMEEPSSRLLQMAHRDYNVWYVEMCDAAMESVEAMFARPLTITNIEIDEAHPLSGGKWEITFNMEGMHWRTFDKSNALYLRIDDEWKFIERPADIYRLV